MSNPTPYQTPVNSPTYETAPRQLRSTGVTVFGILSILLGLLGFVGTLFSVGFMIFGHFAEIGPNPVFDKMEESLPFAVYSYLSMALGIVFTVILVAAGIGMLRMKPWSRQLSVIYAVYAIASAILGAIINVAVVFVPALGQANPGQEAAGVVFGLISVVFGSLIGIVYPIALLIYCLRAETIAMFESWRE